MTTNYKVEKIFTDEEVANLLSLFHSLDESLAHQDYNLFDVDKRTIPFKQWTKELEKLNRYVPEGLTPQSHYFIKYPVDSFTRLHTDDAKVVKMTIVTIIETVNLVGGCTLVFDKYTKNKRPRNRYAKRVNDGPPPIGKDIIPDIVEMQDGESVVYDAVTTHGVSRVKQGHRIVLVSWFK